MATNLAIDDKLINKAKRLGKHKSKKDAVNAALEHYVRRFDLEKLYALFGTIEYFDDYDYKAARNKRADRHRHTGVVGDIASPKSRSPRGRSRQAA
jgi:hypothetical protein